MWEILVMAVVILIVGAVVLFAFNKIFSKEAEHVESQIGKLGDNDGDNVIDTFDKCIERAPANEKVGSDGCTDKQRDKLSRTPSTY